MKTPQEEQLTKLQDFMPCPFCKSENTKLYENAEYKCRNCGINFNENETMPIKNLNHIPTLEDQVEQLSFDNKKKDETINYLVSKRGNLERQLKYSNNLKRSYLICFATCLMGLIFATYLWQFNTGWLKYYQKYLDCKTKYEKVLRIVIECKDIFILEQSQWNNLKSDKERKSENRKDKLMRLRLDLHNAGQFIVIEDTLFMGNDSDSLTIK